MSNQLQNRLRRVERRVSASPAHSLRALLRLLSEDEWPENLNRGFELLGDAALVIVGRFVLGEEAPRMVQDLKRCHDAGLSEWFGFDRRGVPPEREPQLIEQMAALRDSARRHGIGPLMDEQRRKHRHENWVGSGDPMWMWGEPET